MIDCPCRNCTERTAYKNCEKTCQRWVEYKIELERVKKLIKFEKSTRRFLWR